MMHTLTIKLKQHTPLIHFQHDQYGATLRASEVKPKLDKFIIRNVFDDNFSYVNSSLVGYDPQKPDLLLSKFADKDNPYRALNYKMKISIENPSSNEINIKPFSLCGNKVEQFPLLLSNMGTKLSEEDVVQFSFYKEIVITLTSPLQDLLKKIEDRIGLFFTTRNFGQRSNKGFGSFTVSEINGQSIPFDEYKCLPSTHYIQFPIAEETEYRKVFDVIDFYWKCLKSGINFTQRGKYPHRYIKSFLWCYLNNQTEYTWEKRAIKEHFGLMTKKMVRDNKNKIIFARAILGCPDKFEYHNFNKTVTVSHSLPQDNDDYIARIPSPIIFKPVLCVERKTCRVYILFDESIVAKLKSAKNTSFVFECSGKKFPLDVNPSCVDYEQLITLYHNYLSQDKRVQQALFSEIPRDEFSENDKSDWFVALGFKWTNVVGRNKVITFGKTGKLE